MFDLDAHIGLHADALKLRAQRAELIANNLANADTPGFKARDLDFRAVLAATHGGGVAARQVGGAIALTTTQSGHLSTAADAAASTAGALQYRKPLAPSIDGNTVDVQVEQAAFAENAIRYQATLNFVSSRFRGLMTAITGQ